MDLKDLIGCSIVRQWALRPWEDEHRYALADRLEELGLTYESVPLRNRAEVPGYPGWLDLGWHHGEERFADALTRVPRQRILKAWRSRLVALFGSYWLPAKTPTIEVYTQCDASDTGVESHKQSASG